MADGKIIIESNDDAAFNSYGDKWRIPTNEEWDELFSKSLTIWTWDSSQKGYVVRSKIPGFEENYIFLPASGYSGSFMIGSSGYYWALSLYRNSDGEFNSSLGSGISFNYGGGGRLGMSREIERSTRAVYSNE